MENNSVESDDISNNTLEISRSEGRLNFGDVVQSVPGDVSLKFIDSDNNTFLGFCLDRNKDVPSGGQLFTVYNSSSVDNRIKELIVRYYRPDTFTQGMFFRITFAIWHFIHGDPINHQVVQDMVDSLTGLEIGDNYTFTDENNVQHVFNFFLGVPINNNTVQSVLLFNYTNITSPSNETNETNETNQTNQTNQTNETNITDPSNETNITTLSKYPNNGMWTTDLISRADTRKTGLPIITLLLIISGIGLFVKRKK